MRRTALVLALLYPATAAADVDLSYVAGRVDLKARAPLAEVLDKLSKQTGMKVFYDGGAPRMLVNVNLQGVTTSAAVLALLDGLGLDYALQMDRTGTQAATLMLLGSGGGGVTSSGASPSAAPAAGFVNPNVNQEEEEIVDQQQEDEPIEEEIEEVAPPEEAPKPTPEQPQFRPGAPQPWPGAGPAPVFPGSGGLTPFGQPQPKPEEPPKE